MHGSSDLPRRPRVVVFLRGSPLCQRDGCSQLIDSRVQSQKLIQDSSMIKETSFPTVIQPNRQRWVQSVQYSLHVGFLFDHGLQEHDCSMVELLATKPQTPQWFISHWYLGLIRPLWGGAGGFLPKLMTKRCDRR